MESADTLRILGVDPGTLRVGFGLLEMTGASGDSARLLRSGTWTAPASWSPARRLGKLAGELKRLLDAERPACVAVEASFFGRNPNSLIRLGEARGMVLAIAGARGLEVFDYAPATVKKSVTGHGGASKEQIARVLAVLLPELARANAVERLDQTDALAVAWCHVQQQRLARKKDAIERALRQTGA